MGLSYRLYSLFVDYSLFVFRKLRVYVVHLSKGKYKAMSPTKTKTLFAKIAFAKPGAVVAVGVVVSTAGVVVGVVPDSPVANKAVKTESRSVSGTLKSPHMTT